MADSQYPYPPDRFDEEAADVAFHGAHRAEEPFWRQNLVYLIIIAVAVVVLLVLLFVIGGRGQNGDDRAEGPGAQTSSSQSDGGGASDGGGQSDEGGASDGGGDDESSEPDKSRPVLVVNAAGINGLAATWQKTLKDDGWQKVDVQTAQNRQQESVVFYRDEADKDTAQALADSVDAGEARQSDDYQAAIAFVAVEQPDQSDN